MSTSRHKKIADGFLAFGKGYLRRSVSFVPFTLGIRNNIRMTVTVREELFRFYRYSQNIEITTLFTTGNIPVFCFLGWFFQPKEVIL